MFAVACLFALVALCAAAHALRLALRALRLDPWEVLVYLGLAEYELPPRPRLRAY